ncbi:MAG: TonB family protein [Xanthomonadaceae bacterium]|nr:TonB family protein [Xanthomonadaceae bacterium]
MNEARADRAPVPAPPHIGPQERVKVTFLFSILLHAVLVLGVGFAYEEPAARLPSLDVILVQSRSEEKPKDADFLANATQRGGGEHDKSTRPRQPVSSPVPKPDPGLSPVELRASAPRPQPRTPQAVLKTDAQSALSVERAPPQQQEVPANELPSGRELIERSLEMARLTAEIERQSEAYAKRPRRKFISANTQEYEYAAYMRAWVARVERIGNLNYPDEARNGRISGSLVMTVAVRRDGRVERIDVIQPSGHPALDEGARRIVKLAEPFAPLPKFKDEVDILHITRTWQFLPGGVLRNE